MSSGMINLILWIPFAVMLLISGLIYGIRAWKKGLPRTVIHLIVTVIAAMISLLLARLVSGPISSLFLPQLLAEMNMPEDVTAGIVESLVTSAARSVVALIVFPLMLLLCNIILRALSNYIKHPFLETEKYQLRGAALAVGLVTAVFYTFLMMLPIYGTIGAYVPAVRSLIAMSGEAEDEETASLLDALQNHPVVTLSYSGVTAGVYDELSSLSIGSNRVNISGMARSVRHLSEAFYEIENCEPGEEEEAVLELTRVFRSEVVEKPWCYELSMGAIEEFRKQIEAELEYADDEEAELVMDLLDTMQCPEDVFNENLSAFTDLLILAMEEDAFEMIDEQDIDGLTESGVLAATGELLNLNDETVAMKQFIMSLMICDVCDCDPEEAMEIMEDADLDRITGSSNQLREAEAFLLGLNDPETFMLLHPDLGRHYIP